LNAAGSTITGCPAPAIAPTIASFDRDRQRRRRGDLTQLDEQSSE
jgi:hypothetical protein